MRTVTRVGSATLGNCPPVLMKKKDGGASCPMLRSQHGLLASRASLSKEEKSGGADSSDTTAAHHEDSHPCWLCDNGLLSPCAHEKEARRGRLPDVAKVLIFDLFQGKILYIESEDDMRSILEELLRQKEDIEKQIAELSAEESKIVIVLDEAERERQHQEDLQRIRGFRLFDDSAGGKFQRFAGNLCDFHYGK